MPSVPQIIPPSAREITANYLGLRGNGNVDDAIKLNEFIANESPNGPLGIRLDRNIFVTQIQIPAAGMIAFSGMGAMNGAGIIQLPGSNKSMIVGAPPGLDVTLADGTWGACPAPQGQGVIFDKLWFDQQRDSQSGYNFGIDLVGYFGLLFRDCAFYRARKYSLRLTNVRTSRITGCRFIPMGDYGYEDSAVNTDGIHLNGVCADIIVSDCYFRTRDDAIALNAPEGYGGDIDGMLTNNCDFDGCLSAMRMYTQNSASVEHEVRNVVVSNCVCKCTTAGFLLGAGYDIGSDNYPRLNPNGLKNISFSNVQVTAGAFAYFSVNVGSLKANGCTWTPTNRHANFGKPFGAFTIYTMSQGIRLNGFCLTDFTIVRSDLYSGPACIVDAQATAFGGSNSPLIINGASLNGFTVSYLGIEEPLQLNGQPSTPPCFFLHNNGNNSLAAPTVQELRLASVSTTHLTSILVPQDFQVNGGSYGMGTEQTSFAPHSVYGNLIGMRSISDQTAGNGCFYFSTEQGTACVNASNSAVPLAKPIS